MRSKNSKPFTTREREWIETVKLLPCSTCGAGPPSAAHHIKQGIHRLCVAWCWECHQGPRGHHGDKTLMRIYKHDELDALAVTLDNKDKFDRGEQDW